VVEAKARSHLSVDWYAYFKSIRTQCPWSYAAYLKGQINIVEYTGVKLPIGDYAARMYILSAPDATVASIASAMDYGDTECEWLYSYPGYGEFATPVCVLIQQPRNVLDALRQKLED
jgi:hypothetical protein